MITINDQPINASFFGEGKWLTDYVDPDALEITSLYHELTDGKPNLLSKIETLHQWVGSEIKYRKLVAGRLTIGNKISVQTDLWMSPSLVKQTKIGNCANKSFLLASLLRNALPPEHVHVVLGNLHNGKVGGHAWVQINYNGSDFISEATRADVPTMIPVNSATRYEAVHLFNDKEVYAIPGKTVMEPFQACYSSWLADYLDWGYIAENK
jgi:hypothetical protein